ncbi:MAG: hypothetical protein E6931_11595 [Clostridium botulinum]|nr:hypothetical protein [Clostridium botulinum]
MKAWRDKLDKLLDGEYKLFEEDYKITYPCVLKRGRKRIKGRIDMDRIINLAAGIKVGYMNRRTLMLDKKLYSKTAIRSINLFKDTGDKIDGLEILYLENAIPNVTITNTKLAFWNDGNETIDGSDIAPRDPLAIKIQDDFKILESKIIYTKK